MKERRCLRGSGDPGWHRARVEQSRVSSLFIILFIMELIVDNYSVSAQQLFSEIINILRNNYFLK